MQNDQDQNKGRKSFAERIRPYRFNWVGRTKDGVSRWIGAPKGPSERFCKNFLRYGITMSIVAVIAVATIVAAFYAAIERIESTADHTFIYIGPTQALVIPHHSISAGSYQELMTEIGRKFQPHQPLQRISLEES